MPRPSSPTTNLTSLNILVSRAMREVIEARAAADDRSLGATTRRLLALGIAAEERAAAQAASRV